VIISSDGDNHEMRASAAMQNLEQSVGDSASRIRKEMAAWLLILENCL
jgi:hypothetical protein